MKQMKYNVGTLLGVVGVTTAASLLGATEAQAILIDDWRPSSPGSQDTVDAGESSNFNVSDIFGGGRKVDMTNAIEPNQSLSGDKAFIGNDSQGNRFLFQTGSRGGSRSVTVSYNDEGGQDFSNFRGLTLGQLSGGTSDVPLGLEFTIGSSGNSYSTAFNASRANPQDVFVSFEDDFGVDSTFLKSVTDIGFTIEEQDGNTNPLALGNFEASDPDPVPFNAESWVGLALLGTWGSWKYLKKRNQQKVELTASDEN